jgi:hypothetical protein
VTWLDDRLEQRKTLQEREFDISTHADRVYTYLWAEIKKCADEAAQKGINITTNGAHPEHVLFYSDGPIGLSRHPSFRQDIPSRQLKITLAPDKHTIATSGSSVSLRFVLDVRDGGVCLTLDNKQILYSDAAVAIIDAFVFQELSRLPIRYHENGELSEEEQTALRRLEHEQHE